MLYLHRKMHRIANGNIASTVPGRRLELSGKCRETLLLFRIPEEQYMSESYTQKQDSLSDTTKKAETRFQMLADDYERTVPCGSLILPVTKKRPSYPYIR